MSSYVFSFDCDCSLSAAAFRESNSEAGAPEAMTIVELKNLRLV
jgi:hypothetical protein